MSEYNSSKTIPIDSLSKEELKVAIKEWSEGIEGLERLLWSFYNKNIKTSGCHAGPHSYIGLKYNSNYKDSIIKLFNYALLFKGTKTMLSPDGGNPFSGPSWYEPGATIGCETPSIESAERGFGLLADSLEDKIKEAAVIDTTPIFKLQDFLLDKCSGIDIHVEHLPDDNYRFSLCDSLKEDRLLFTYLNSHLKKLGFELNKIEDSSTKIWSYTTKNPDEFNSKLNETANDIINTYTFDVPKSPDEVDDFNLKALIMRNKSQEEFEIWLDEQEKILEQRRIEHENEIKKHQ